MPECKALVGGAAKHLQVKSCEAAAGIGQVGVVDLEDLRAAGGRGCGQRRVWPAQASAAAETELGHLPALLPDLETWF